MKTIKIIDLLNMIAKGEEVPQEIRYKHKEYKWERNVDYKEKNERNFLLSDECINETFLNDEVKIIEEEKEIEMCEVLEHCVDFSKNENVLLDNQLRLQDKINELIDVVNEMRKEK